MIVVHHRYDFDQTEPVLVYDGSRPAIWGNDRLCQAHMDKVGLSEKEFAYFFDGPNYIASPLEEGVDPFDDIPNAEEFMWNYPPGEEEMPDDPQIYPPRSFYEDEVTRKAADKAVEAFEGLGGGSDPFERKADESGSVGYEEADDHLYRMHERLCQYDGELSKAPPVWNDDETIPEYVKQAVLDVIEAGVVWDKFDGYSKQTADAVRNSLEENLTQPQGWSLKSLVNDLLDMYPGMGERKAMNIVRTETSAIFNTARQQAYEDREDADNYVYYWQGPDDHRTTEVCKEIREEVEQRGGSVTLRELKNILHDKARKYEGTREGGTPERADEWVPHYQCRSTFVRDVKADL
jgi:hypothetical protein